MNILSLDVGTTSMRGILYREDGAVLAEHSILTPLLIDQRSRRMEQRPEVYLEGAESICRAITESHAVDAVSVTAFRSAPTLVDREGRALRPFIMWQDTRNSEICRRLTPFNHLVYQTCGAPLNTVFTASKITWMKENEPDLYRAACKAMIVPDYIICHLTGAFGTDYTYGSRSLLMDIHSLRYSREMLEIFDIEEEKLCELRAQGAICGTVQAEFAGRTGLRQGTPVVSAGGDQQCGALGLGVLDSSTIEVNSGTGSFVISLIDRPCLDNPAVICNVAAIPGLYTQEMNVIASASGLNWLIRELFPEHWDGAPDYETVNRIAAETPPGAHGLLAVPHFQGCGSRDWNPAATAGFWGFTLGSRKRDLIRALYEGIAAEIAKNIEELPPVCRKAGEIAVAGGLSKSDVYLQILSDMTERKLVRSRHHQATARGAFLSAAAALGLYRTCGEAAAALRCREDCAVFKPSPEGAAFYRSYYKQRTERLYKAACWTPEDNGTMDKTSLF